jgi:hypothetical protein
VAGCGFLARRAHLVRYILPPGGPHGLPIDRPAMTIDGLISGYPLPLLQAHHMDDPRSPYCLMSRTGRVEGQASLTARSLGFTSVADYAAWIAADARKILRDPLAVQIQHERRYRDQSYLARVRRKLGAILHRCAI